MTQRVNQELIENLRPFITRIANEAAGTYNPTPTQPTPDPTPIGGFVEIPVEPPDTSGVVFYDHTTKEHYRVFLSDSQLFIELYPGARVDMNVPDPPFELWPPQPPKQYPVQLL